MIYFVICLAALITSGLTLFSGFGLGTLLMPVFAIFFLVEVAIVLTAIVHFLNNVFKLLLVGKYTDKSVALRFGLPAIIFAFVGAKILLLLSGLKTPAVYQMFGELFEVTPVEVKSRITGAPTITVTRNEILYSLNKPEDFILAIVELLDADSYRVHYLRRPFQREPDFGVTSVNYDFAELLARAEAPR